MTTLQTGGQKVLVMTMLLFRRKIHLRRTLINVIILTYCLLVLFALFNKNGRVRMDMPVVMVDPVFVNSVDDHRRCRINMEELDIVHMNIYDNPDLSMIEAANEQVERGGSWKPKDCRAWQKIAIIIPYRDRWEHLKVLLKRIHPMLQKQKANYQIFILEQAGDGKFNRGKLMNVGVKEALKKFQFDCFIFQDVDLLPENDQNIYYCDEHARHLASAIDEMRYHVMYYNYAGGVIALNRENVFKVNGYSNGYWGWGNEDDDLSARTMEAGLLLTRPPEHIGRYKMVRHPKSWRSDNGYGLFMSWRSRWKKDGINNLDSSQYKVIKEESAKLYTKFVVDLGTPSLPPNDGPKESVFWFLQFFFPKKKKVPTATLR